MLETQEEFHTLEAAEPEIAIERDAVGMRDSPKLPDESLEDLENASLSLRGADPALLVPYEVIAWKTVPGAPVAHAGVVRFDDDPAGTRVHVTMRYNPPAGALGHALATILGADPKRALDEDLVTFKSLLEDGKTSVRGEVSRREALG